MNKMPMPWESDMPQDLYVSEPEKLGNLAELIEALQNDMHFMAMHTAVLVRSNNEALRMVFNTERGQEMPKPLKCTFQDGTTMEFQDLGMPQPRVPTKTVKEIVETALDKAFALGLKPS